MPRWQPLHPELAAAIDALDALDMPYAELWRLLRRRRAIVVRRQKLERARVVAEIYGDMVSGYFPYRFR